MTGLTDRVLLELEDRTRSLIAVDGSQWTIAPCPCVVLLDMIAELRAHRALIRGTTPAPLGDDTAELGDLP